MTKLSEYEVDAPGGGKMTIQVSDKEAEQRGLKKKAAAAPKNKAKKAAANKKA